MKEKIKVNFLIGNETKTVEGKVGESVLEIAGKNKINIPSRCEGNGACGTCHIILEKSIYDLSDTEDEEEDVLEKLLNRTSTSRLACKTILTKEMNNANIIIPNGEKNEE